MKNNLVLVALAAVLTGGAGFFGGIQYQKTTDQPSAMGGQFGYRENGQLRGAGANGTMANDTTNRARVGFNPVTGEITSLTDTTMTIKTADGGSKVVVYSTSTSVHKSTAGSLTDLQLGEQVMVMGTEDETGTLTAKNISLGEAGVGTAPAGQMQIEKNN